MAECNLPTSHVAGKMISPRGVPVFSDAHYLYFVDVFILVLFLYGNDFASVYFSEIYLFVVLCLICCSISKTFQAVSSAYLSS